MELRTIALNASLSCTFYGAVNFASRLATPKDLKHESRAIWRQKVTSLVHSLIISLVAPYVFVTEPEFLTNPVSHYHMTGCYGLFVSIGYFLYDTLDIFINTLHHKDTFERLIHHIFSSAGIVRILSTGDMTAYGLMVLVAEINTIFIRTRKLLMLKGIREGLLYKWNVRVNLVTFALFKVCLIFCTTVWGTWCAYLDLYLKQDRLVDLFNTSGLLLTVSLLNWISFKRLLKSDLKTVMPSDQAKALWSHAGVFLISNLKSLMKALLLTMKILTLALTGLH